MIPVLLIVVPLISGVISFFLRSESTAKAWALFSSVITLIISLLGLTLLNDYSYLHADKPWMESLGSNFSVSLDGMGQLLCLLTALAFPLVFVSTYSSIWVARS